MSFQEVLIEEYDWADRLVKAITVTNVTQAGTTLITNIEYDLAGNKESVTDANGLTITYTYEARNRLTSETSGAGETIKYAYDRLGNRISATDPRGSTAADGTFTTWYVYDALNRHIRTVMPDTTVPSDPYGNLDLFDNPYIEYTYYPNGLKETEKDPNGTSQVSRQTNYRGDEDPKTVNYYSDSRGIQIRENNLYYFHNSNGVSRIVDASNSTAHNYVRYGVQVLASSDGFFYIVNARGDVVALVSETDGSIVGYYTYDAFGGLRAAQKNTGKFNKFKFAGGLQSATGNYVFGARLYSPGEGRWISLDGYRGSESDPLSLNRYAYCHNDPVNFVDPSGFKESKTHNGREEETDGETDEETQDTYLIEFEITRWMQIRGATTALIFYYTLYRILVLNNVNPDLASGI